MIIFDGDLDEGDVRTRLEQVEQQVATAGGRVATTDFWGKRRFAYEIDHKHDGYYVVLELVTEGAGFPDMERSLRLADEVVRHKLLRLPDHEATRRGLLGEATPA
jgi:small subunit ribosomal protein S6